MSRASLNKLVKFVFGRLDQTGIGEFPSELGEECQPVMKEWQGMVFQVVKPFCRDTIFEVKGEE